MLLLGCNSRAVRPPVWFLLAAFAALLAARGPGSQAVDDDYGLRSYSISKKAGRAVRLNLRIREISGLASLPDGRLFGHDDERAVIYELDSADGRLVKAFAFGEPAAMDDFEGLAVAHGRFYLVTSGGRIYSGREGSNGERVAYERYTSGLDEGCEVEGLAHEPDRDALLLLCKRPRRKGGKARVDIHLWSLAERELLEGESIDIRVSKLTKGIPGKSFHPAAIERHPVTGNYFLAAGPELALAEVTPGGRVVAVEKLPSSRHRQVEGIAFAQDLAILVADEGGTGHARLTRYAR